MPLEDDGYRSPVDADVLGAIGGSLAGLGGRGVQAMAHDLTSRGNALRELAARRRSLRKTPEELDAMAARAAKDRAVAANYGKTKPEKDTSFDDASKIRRELSGLPETEALGEVEAGYTQLHGAKDTPTGDVARIYALAKIFDPGGRVTQGDYDAAKQGQGPMARFQAYINEVEGNGFLSPQTRANMLAEAQAAYDKRKKDYGERAATFSRIAKKRGLDPDDVVVRKPPGADRPAPAAPGGSGLTPEQRKQRMEEIRKRLGGVK